MLALAWVVMAFGAGACPLSVWLGRLALGVDIRQIGDGNPGAANVWRAGGAKWGVTAILLDFLKGVIPVGLANFWAGIEGWPMAVIAVAPILGHAFSPFLGFRGGKALAVTFGIWTGLTLWVIPTILGLFFAVWLALIAVEGWAVLAGLLSLLGVLFLMRADSVWLLVWGGSTAILMWKHRADLAQRPKRRSFSARR